MKHTSPLIEFMQSHPSSNYIPAKYSGKTIRVLLDDYDDILNDLELFPDEDVEVPAAYILHTPNPVMSDTKF